MDHLKRIRELVCVVADRDVERLEISPAQEEEEAIVRGTFKTFYNLCNLLIDTQLEVLVVQGNLFRRDFVGGVKTPNT